MERGVQLGINTLAMSSAAYAVARRVFEDPSQAHQPQGYQQQLAGYTLLWSYYSGAMFDRTARILNSAYSAYSYSSPYAQINIANVYKSNYSLYRNIRLIYNPVRRLVDFYAGAIYPGVLSEDGSKLPDGVSLAVPFTDDTPKALKDAVAQFWQWTNWQAKKAVQVRYGGALGSVMLELVDDLDKKRVCAEVVWPGFVPYHKLDYAGNLQEYMVQYYAHDNDGMYLYQKVVDKQAISYFRNQEPYDYGNGAVVPNPYGFVPAVWIKHIDTGSDFGSPAIAGSLGKVDELNSVASHVHDQIHKVIGAPALISTSNLISKNIFEAAKRGATAEFDEPTKDQEQVMLLKGPADAKVQSLAGALSLSDSSIYMDKLIAEIEEDHPELAFYRELRSMSQVTGPAASRLVGDVASRVGEASANYDQGSIKLFQMAVAIAGFRANSGAWGPLNKQQEKFKPFNLDSYQRGDLDMAIMPRPLLVPTKMEIAQEKEYIWRGVKEASYSNVPASFVLKYDQGWDDAKLAELQQAMDAQVQKTQQAQQMMQQQQQQAPQQSQQQQGNNGQQSGQASPFIGGAR